MSVTCAPRARELQAEGKIRDLCTGQDFEHRIVELYKQSNEITKGLDIMLIRGRAPTVGSIYEGQSHLKDKRHALR